MRSLQIYISTEFIVFVNRKEPLQCRRSENRSSNILSQINFVNFLAFHEANQPHTFHAYNDVHSFQRNSTITSEECQHFNRYRDYLRNAFIYTVANVFV